MLFSKPIVKFKVMIIFNLRKSIFYTVCGYYPTTSKEKIFLNIIEIESASNNLEKTYHFYIWEIM